MLRRSAGLHEAVEEHDIGVGLGDRREDVPPVAGPGDAADNHHGSLTEIGDPPQRSAGGGKSPQVRRHAVVSGVTISVASERRDRIDRRSGSRGDPCRDERNRDEEHRRERDRRRIGRLDAEKQARKQPRQRKGGQAANDQPDERHRHALAQDHAEDRSPFGPEREADAELVRALADREGEHTGDADRRDRQCEEGEESDQRGVEPLGRDRLVADFFQRLDMVDRTVRIQLADRLHHARRKSVGRASCPNEQCRHGARRVSS
jgi:hypothetical protein